MGRRKRGDEPIVDRFMQETGDVLQVADAMRKRQWFLTINQDAECYKSFDDYVVSYGEKGSGYYHYAYIKHDKDTISQKAFEHMLDNAEKNNDINLFDRLCGYIELPYEQRTSACYAYKPPHYHLLMCFENARTWSSVKNHFKGAHVQSCLSVVNSFMYLTHNTKESIEKGKTKYSLEEVAFSPRGMEFFNSQQGEEINFDYFDPHKIAKYVWIDDMNNYHEFLLRFGAPQCQRWLSSINSECNVKQECSYYTDSKGNTRWVNGKFCYYDAEKGLQFLNDKEIEALPNRLYILSNSSVADVKDYINGIMLSDFGKNYYTAVLYYRMKMNEIERYIVSKALPYYAKKFGIGTGELEVETVNDVPFTFANDFQLKVVNQ